MLITGLILTLENSAELPEATLAALRTNPAVATSERNGPYLPVATVAEHSSEAEQLQEWLAGLPGVAQVDVVSVQFEENRLAMEELP